MEDILCRFLKIEKSELEKTVLVFIFFFTVIFSYYLIKPSKDALFVHYVGTGSMSTAFIIIPVLTLLFLFLYDFLVRKFSRRTFSTTLIFFFASNLIILWLMFKAGLKRDAAYCLYVWSDIYSVATVTQFWSITNDIYTSEGAKRVYGFIGIGSQLGGILGSFVTTRIKGHMDTENLLLLSAVFTSLIAVIIIRVDTLARRQEESFPIHELKSKKPDKCMKGVAEICENFRMVVCSRYLLLFTILLCIMIMCSKLIDFQIGRVMENVILDKDSKTIFMGNIYFWANSLSFILLFFAPLLYKYLGIFGALLLAPSVNIITLGAFAALASLNAIVVTKVLDGSLKYGISQVTREMLYIPCTREEKYRAKAVIDILFYRLANVFTAILMIFFTGVIALSVQSFNIVIIALLCINLWVLYRLSRAFVDELERKICLAWDERLNDRSGDMKESSDADAQMQPDLKASPAADKGSFDETALLKSLISKVKEALLPDSRFVNAIEIIAGNLPELAKAGRLVYHREGIEKAILILSRYYKDSFMYSLTMQYLTLALPYRIRRTYLILLSQHAPASRILNL
ncbi:MAG: NTP/NDP exchange transporter [Candidatus Xenobiia bacterium LiM19]